MEENKTISKGLGRIEDMADTASRKIGSVTGLLELICMGISSMDNGTYPPELSGMSVIKEYLSSVNKNEIASINKILEEIRENS